MDRMPNVAVSSASGRGGMLKSTQNQTLFSWQGTIKTVKCCVILYIYTVIYIVKTLQDGVGTSPRATKIVGKKRVTTAKRSVALYKKNNTSNSNFEKSKL